MKTLPAIFMIILFTSVMITGCKDDDKEEVSPFVGNFVINSAELAQELMVSTVEMGDVPLAVGTDITQAIQTALLSSVSCSSPDKSYVELRKDFSMYISCEGNNAMNAGTWEEVSSSELILNMNNAAIPSSPTGFALTVTNIVTSATGLTGTTSVPIPKAMIAGMIAPLTLSASAPEVSIMTFTLEFVKK
jgi:hypothetical protein